MNTKNYNQIFLLLLGILAIALFRIIPHYPNFTPVAAVALFAGAHFRNKTWAFLLPISGMLASDLILGFHSTMPWVYTSFFLTILVGMGFGKPTTAMSVVGGSLASSVLFFMITNFGTWISQDQDLYPHTAEGLGMAYTAALPFALQPEQFLPGATSFFANDFWATIVFSAIFFGAAALLNAPKAASKEVALERV